MPTRQIHALCIRPRLLHLMPNKRGVVANATHCRRKLGSKMDDQHLSGDSFARYWPADAPLLPDTAKLLSGNCMVLRIVARREKRLDLIPTLR
jgi:hypothetical protein